MASMVASTSGLMARASQRAGSCRRPAPFTAARQFAMRNTAARAAAEGDADAAEVVVVDPAEAELLVAGVAATAGIEAELVGPQSEERAFLTALAGQAGEAALADALVGGGAGESLLEQLAAEVAGDAEDAEVTESYPPTQDNVDEEDVLSLLPNEDVDKAMEVVRSLKLPPQDLKTLVPKDWDTTTVDWFANARRGEEVPLPEYRLTFLWGEDTLLAAVDQLYARGATSPLTEYFDWPLKDAWDNMRQALEARPWISERDKVALLNRLTDIINYWQVVESPQEGTSVRPTLEEARAAFPDCTFSPGSAGRSAAAAASQAFYATPAAAAPAAAAPVDVVDEYSSAAYAAQADPAV